MKKPIVCLLAVLLATTACDISKSGSPTGPSAFGTESPAPGEPATVYPRTGPEVVACVAAKYPEKLAAGVSHAERVANMEFIRDRVIETGLCGGMLLAWNLKRGVGPRSIDAIDWRHGEADINDVVDLASDYDNTSAPLKLHWVVVAGPAGWDPFPEPSCR